jgi:hypothetical protein
MTLDGQLLLRRAITASGLSARQFARLVMLRHERTVRRWLDGSTAVPPLVLNRLTHYLDGKPVPVKTCKHGVPTAYAPCKRCNA